MAGTLKRTGPLMSRSRFNLDRVELIYEVHRVNRERPTRPVPFDDGRDSPYLVVGAQQWLFLA
jgi:hypothetical protein